MWFATRGGRGAVTHGATLPCPSMDATAHRGTTQLRLSWFRAVVVLLVHPELWTTAIRQAVRMARPRWWSRPPFLPLPDRGYTRFRFETAYGEEGSPGPGDLVAYLRWCRDRRR